MRPGGLPGAPARADPALCCPSQTAACPTRASPVPSAAAFQTAPGPAAPAPWASWATAHTVRTWTRWVPGPGKGCPRSRGRCSPPLIPQCAVVTDVCFTVGRAQRCVNTNPGFHCLPCPPRYKGTQPFGVGLEVARTEKQVSNRPLVFWEKAVNQSGRPQSTGGQSENTRRPPWARRQGVLTPGKQAEGCQSLSTTLTDRPGGGRPELSRREPERTGATTVCWRPRTVTCGLGPQGRFWRAESTAPGLRVPAAPGGRGPAPLPLSRSVGLRPAREGWGLGAS